MNETKPVKRSKSITFPTEIQPGDWLMVNGVAIERNTDGTWTNLDTVPIGASHIRWGLYTESGELIREVPADEVPWDRGLEFGRFSMADGVPGFAGRSPDGDGYYICFMTS